MKLFKKTIAIILCMLMIVSVTACGEDTSWVLKTEKTDISAGHYLYYLINAYSNASYMVEDPDKSILSQTIDGKKAANWIEDTALESAKFAITVKEMFEAEGLELSAENQEYVNQMANYYWAYFGQTLFLPNGVSYDTLLKATTYDVMKTQLFEHLYGEGGEREISAEDVKKGLVENYAKIKEIGISLVGMSGEMRSEKVQETLKAKAEDYKKRIEAGEKIEDLIKEHYDVEINLAVEETGKTADEITGGTTAEDIDTDAVVVNNDSTNYSDNEKKEILKLANGEVKVLVEKEHISVVQKMDILEDDTYLKEYDMSVRITLKGDEFIEELQELAKEVEVEINEAGLKKYKPSKVKLS